MPVSLTLPVEISAQPDDRSCGATALQAVYRYYEDDVPLDQLMRDIPQLENGGTLGVHLALHALARGYRATIYTYNLQVFDISWFAEETDLSEKLRQQSALKSDSRLEAATTPYLEFLANGGKVEFEDLDGALIKRHVRRGVPILTGLSATYLYRAAREDPTTDKPDDTGGAPVGHFVVLSGIDVEDRVSVADPYDRNPVAEGRYYLVSMDRLIGAICLGIVTYDANLLLIEPPGEGAG